MSSRFCAVLLCTLLLASFGRPLRAAETPPAGEAAPAAEEPAGPQPIPIPEVIDRASAEQRKLQEIQVEAEETAAIRQIVDGVPAATTRLRDESQALRGRIERMTRSRDVEDAEKTWQRGRRSLELQHATVTDRAREIEQMMTRLAEVGAVWQATKEAARAGDAPPAVLEQIGTTLRQVDATRKSVSRSRDRVVALQAQIAALLAEHDEFNDYVAEQKEALRTSLLSEGVPLWTALWRSEGVLSWAQAVEHVERDVELMRAFAYDHRRPMAAHAFSIVFLSGLLVFLRARESQRSEAEQREAVRIFQRPYASAFLMLVVPAHYMLYSTAPTVARGVIGITSLVAALRLTPVLLPTSAHAAFYSVAILFFIDRLRDLIAGLALLERLVFTGEILFAMVALGLFQRPANLAAFSQSPRWSAALGFAVRLGVILLGAAFVASVAGSEIGGITAQGVFAAAYTGMVLYLAYEVLADLVALGLRSEGLQRLHMFENHSELIARRTLSTLRFLGVVVWCQNSLVRFGISDAVLGAIAGVLTAQLAVGTLSVSLGAILSLGATLVIAVYTSRLVRFILDEDVLPRLPLPRGVAYAVSATVHQIILIVGFLAALAAGGVDLSQFGILAGALGVGVGFGLQNVVNNFVSGMILLFERPIKTGDTIEVGTLMGEVRRIGIRSSTVRTFEGAEVIVPNANLISDEVVNWTLSDQVRRIDVNVRAALGADPEKVIAILREVGQTDARLLREPGPTVLFLGFGDSALDFQLRTWTADFSNWITIRSDLHVAVNRALREAGIEIPLPQSDLHVKSLPEKTGRDPES